MMFYAQQVNRADRRNVLNSVLESVEFELCVNCSAMRSVVDLLIQITVRDRTVNMQSCYEFVKITSRQIGLLCSLYGN